MNTIHRRMTVVVLASVIVVLAIGNILVYGLARSSMHSQLDTLLETRAKALAALSSYEHGGYEIEVHNGPMQTVGDGFYEFRTMDGALLTRSASLHRIELPIHVLREGETVFEDVQLPGIERSRCIWFCSQPRVEPDSGEANDDDDVDVIFIEAPEALPIVVAVAVDCQSVDKAVSALGLTLLLVGVLVSLGACVGLYLGIRWGLSPLRDLKRQIEDVSGETGHDRLVDTDVPEELRPVYLELNCMLDRVEATLRRERSFADSTAHELRSPLAELRAVVEVAVRWPDEKPAAATLDDVLAIADDLERVVESLLLISRGCSGNGAEKGTHLNLQLLVRPLLETLQPYATKKHLTIDVNVAEESAFDASMEQAMRVIVRNLMDNAVRYCADGGRVSISDASEDGQACMRVSNGPVSLRDDEFTRLFEPFWRADDARTDRAHVGLGLTVVQKVAAAVGLTVEASLEEHILTIVVRASAT